MNKFRNIIFLLLIPFSFSSCLVTNYHTEYNEPNISGSYPQEKWLFVTSDAPTGLQDDFDRQIIQFLEDCYGKDFANYKTNKNEYLLPDFTYGVDKNRFINQLNKANEIHFYLHVNAEVLRSDVGAGLDFKDTKPYNEMRIRVTFEVIDIVKKESVYSQSVIGITTREETSKEDVLLTLPLNNQFKKAFKRAFKNFKRDFACQR